MDAVQRAAEWAGLALDDDMVHLLGRFEEWLRDEAVPAGALGPAEVDRIGRRHVADSLCFASAWRGLPPERLADVGSGAGLPGLPLAITHPRVPVTLIERAGRRVTLLRRAIRVLGLDNVDIVSDDLDRVESRWPVVVSRATIPWSQADRLIRLLERPGTLVLGGSHLARPQVTGFQVIDIPPEILASPAWLLTMARP